MKKYIYILSVCLLAVWSCDDKLDLEPEEFISFDAAFANEESVEGILLGVYDEAGQGPSYGGQLQVISDLLGATNQLTWQGTFIQPREYFQKSMLVDNTWAENAWRNGYETINQANLVIDNVSIFQDATRAQRVEGEARFLRALIYFDLVRHFGETWVAGGANNTAERGVPLHLAGIVDYGADLSIARATVAEVYAQVITDLQTAMTLLPATNGEFADQYSAEALLARVYLQQGNFAGARDAANSVITNSGHTLAPTYADAFNNDSDGVEDVFMFQVTNQSLFDRQQLITFYADQPTGGRQGDIAVAPAYATLFDDPVNDVRASFTYVSVDNGLNLTRKYSNQFANIQLIRLAEMHLIRAEANLEAGTTTGATPVADVNAVRTRSGAPALAAVTVADVLNERQLELAFEGFLIHDLKRTQTDVGTTAWNSGTLISPIPQDEMDTNPLMQQNDAY